MSQRKFGIREKFFGKVTPFHVSPFSPNDVIQIILEYNGCEETMTVRNYLKFSQKASQIKFQKKKKKKKICLV